MDLRCFGRIRNLRSDLRDSGLLTAGSSITPCV